MITRALRAGLAGMYLITVPAIQAQEEKQSEPAGIEPRISVTEHSIDLPGGSINYTVTAGETVIRDGDGNPAAAIFSMSYIAEDAGGDRPVFFIWNGGPGSSSVWLHMGAFGPKRVAVPPDARDDGAPPYPIVENEATLLDVADLVFIDPVGTGLSRPLGEAEGKDFYGVHKDARSIAQFIREWLTAHGRWNSPKFIGGESYGTTRSAAVIRELEGSFDDVAINGIILISTILDFTIVQPDRHGNFMPYVTQLPTMAATAHYHGRAGQDQNLDDFVQAARDFALGDYASALLQGNSLSGAARADIRGRLAAFTGLSEDYLEDADLRISASRYQKELLRDEGLTVGRLDSRYTGVDLDAAGEFPETDPSFYGIDGAYSTAMNHYLRNDLGYEADRQYSIIGGLGGRWDWDLEQSSPFYFNVAPYIGRAMRQNSGLHVFVAAGYYDFATPLLGAEYSLNRSGVVPERITWTYYEGGHMMYVEEESRLKLSNDIRAFIRNALANTGR